MDYLSMQLHIEKSLSFHGDRECNNALLHSPLCIATAFQDYIIIAHIEFLFTFGPFFHLWTIF